MKLLNRLTKNNVMPDVYFVLYIYDHLQFPCKVPQISRCDPIPFFVFNKNCNPNSKTSHDNNKFLLPDLYVIQNNWDQFINEIK